MCSTTYTFKQQLDAYKGLLYVYFNLKDDLLKKDKKLCDIAIQVLNIELNMRIGVNMRTYIEDFAKSKVFI